ncbi:hypothetical protein EDD85DRAFT_784314 [Armillaria nabsnona]|nr:hypothetical protein EDD85DRAFT_784314 [Armillaria nabsnona]
MSAPETPDEVGTEKNEVASGTEVYIVPMSRAQLVLVFGHQSSYWGRSHHGRRPVVALNFYQTSQSVYLGSLDWTRVFLTITVVTLFLLPVQRGGNERPWSVIILLVLSVTQSGITLAIFIAWVYRKGLKGLLPLDMFMRRNMLGIRLHSSFLYQLRGHSATKSGIDIIPFMVFFYFINYRKLLFFPTSAERKLHSNLGNRSIQNGHNFILILHLFRCVCRVHDIKGRAWRSKKKVRFHGDLVTGLDYRVLMTITLKHALGKMPIKDAMRFKLENMTLGTNSC